MDSSTNFTLGDCVNFAPQLEALEVKQSNGQCRKIPTDENNLELAEKSAYYVGRRGCLVA